MAATATDAPYATMQNLRTQDYSTRSDYIQSASIANPAFPKGRKRRLAVKGDAGFFTLFQIVMRN